MKKLVLAAAALTLTSPALSQSAQERLDARYDRALAAGYKALFLCSAIGNAEWRGLGRSPESVIEWELAGIQSPQNEVIGALPYRIIRTELGGIDYVAVDWSEDAPARLARFKGEQGCSVQPIGQEETTTSEPLTKQRWRGGGLYNPDPGGLVGSVLNQGLSETYGTGTRTTAISVAWGNGQSSDIFAPGYSLWTQQRTWSVAKSIAATLVGAAVQRGETDVMQSAGLGEGEGDPRSEITIDHALRMATGRYSDTPGNRTDALYFGGATVDEVAVDWPLIHRPGTVFRYANNDTLAAVQAIKHSFAEHPPAEILRAARMHSAVAETDWRGNYVLSSQVWASVSDLRELGYLYLNDGVTRDGTRILPEGWLEYVSTPSGPQPDGPFGYGAGWWLLNKSEGVPPDTIAAMGNRGQYVVVVPSRNVVIVRRGEDPVGARFDIAAFTRDVLAALD